MTSTGVHPEDDHIYATEQHDALVAIAAAVNRVADLIALLVDGERSIAVRQSGAWITREDRE